MKNKIKRILEQLAALYPDAGCSLEFGSPWQLLVATILSAQCTDERVNKVTPALFARFPDAKAATQATMEEIIELVRSTGFYQNKAKSILGAAKTIWEDYGGQVPSTLEQLVKLPGVGRKTANVVLGDAFGIPGITVDTHVGRLSRRLGLTTETDPEKVERGLMAIIPHKQWTVFSHRLIYHGRQVCQARKPACAICGLYKWCGRVGVAATH